MDVEGVWSSKANTPLQSPKSSAPSSPQLGPAADGTVGSSTSRKSRDSKRSTSRARLGKRQRRVFAPQQDGKDRPQTSAGLLENTRFSADDAQPNDYLESRRSPVLQTMRGRPAWQPDRYRGGHPSSSTRRMPKRTQSDTSDISSSNLRLETARHLGLDKNAKISIDLDVTASPSTASVRSYEQKSLTGSRAPGPARARPPLQRRGNYLDLFDGKNEEAKSYLKSTSWPLKIIDGRNSQAILGGQAQTTSIAEPLTISAQNDDLTSNDRDRQRLESLIIAQLNQGHVPRTTDSNTVEIARSYESSDPRTRYSTSLDSGSNTHYNTALRRIGSRLEDFPASTYGNPRTSGEWKSTRSSKETSNNESHPKRLHKRRRSNTQDGTRGSNKI